MKQFLSRFAAVMLLIATAFTVSAQSNSREYIRNCIKKWGECRNVAITRTNGDLALYGRNGSARSSCPTSLNKVLDELNRDEQYIDDVVLTEKGSWIVLYGDNGLRWSNIPSDLEKELRRYNNDGEVITAVTLNDGGEWAIVSTTHISSSASSITDWLLEGCDKYGACWTVCMTDDGMVAVYANGYRYLGEVPQSLKDALGETSLDVYRLKFAGNSWFFADKNGSYRYSM